jgi:hypothetical protein
VRVAVEGSIASQAIGVAALIRSGRPERLIRSRHEPADATGQRCGFNTEGQIRPSARCAAANRLRRAAIGGSRETIVLWRGQQRFLSWLTDQCAANRQGGLERLLNRALELGIRGSTRTWSSTRYGEVELGVLRANRAGGDTYSGVIRSDGVQPHLRAGSTQ